MKHITKRQNNRIFNTDLTKPGQNIYIDIVIFEETYDCNVLPGFLLL